MSDVDRLAVELDDIRRRVSALERQVRRLVDEDRIAEQVAARIRERRAQLVSLPVKLAAVVVALSATFSAAWRIYTLLGG